MTRHNLARGIELRLDHTVSELLRISKERLLLQSINQILLFVKMLSSLLEILLLLKNTEPTKKSKGDRMKSTYFCRDAS